MKIAYTYGNTTMMKGVDVTQLTFDEVAEEDGDDQEAGKETEVTPVEEDDLEDTPELDDDDDDDSDG